MKTKEIRAQRSDVRGGLSLGAPASLPATDTSTEAPKHRSTGLLAFTLIELLVVIAIIAILASMIFPISGAVNKAKIRSRALAELTQIETAIAQYQIKLGHYPPDNTGLYTTNQLFFELMGTTLNNGVYKTLDGSCQLDATQVSNVFRNVSGFVNCTRGAGGDEGQIATAFLNALRPDQTAELDSGAKLLVGPVIWPAGGYQQSEQL
jgi:prepilin-type N-terminal cleavage/methylation domain-containing protein